MLAIEHRSPVDGSSGPSDDINKDTVLLGEDISWWTVIERTNSQTAFSKKRLSVIAWPEVLQTVTIFYLSYFLLTCYFSRMKYLCFCCPSIIFSYFYAHMSIIKLCPFWFE